MIDYLPYVQVIQGRQ